MGLTWMAWTWPTAAFFLHRFASHHTIWSFRPGPEARFLGLDTTRGDRLFITLLSAHPSRWLSIAAALGAWSSAIYASRCSAGYE
jgi:predicted small integral membrane protein